MSNRVDYYFRQQVTEAELDRGFDLLEQAEHDIVVDQGITGAVIGLGVGENGPPDLQVQIANGVAYSKDGERINVPAPAVVDLSQDDASASTAVGAPANEKWVSVFVVFDRLLSDPRIDGNSLTVFFERAESFSFSVVQGAEAALGTATRPALDSGKILLADTLLIFGQTTIVNAGLDTTRRENRTFPLGSSLYGGGPTWADGTTNPATDVESQLDKVIDDLGQSNAGADRILSAAIAGSPSAITQASVFGQLTQLLAALNTHANSGGEHLTLNAVRQLLAGGILEAAAAKAVDEPIIRDLRVVTADAALILELPGGLGAQKIRIYAGLTDSRAGLTITWNAVWVPATNLWNSDAAGEAIRFGFFDTARDFTISARNAVDIGGAGITWADDATGWTNGFEGITLVSSPAGLRELRLENEGVVLLGEQDPQPGNNVVQTHALYSKTIPKAWGRLTTDGVGGFTIAEGIRIHTTTAISGTNIRVQLSPGLPDADYVVVVTESAGAYRHWAVGGKTTTQFDLTVRDAASDAVLDPATASLSVDFVVFSKEAIS